MSDKFESGGSALDSSGKSAETRNAILRAAKEAFAEQGYAGARIEEIVKKSGVNVRMIYHHFENKEGLYEAVIEAEVLKSGDMGVETDGLCPVEALRLLITRYIERCMNDPAYVRIVLWEGLTNRRTARRVAEGRPIFVDLLSKTIEAGKAEGGFRPDAHVQVATTTILMGILHNVFNQDRFMEMMGITDPATYHAQILETMMAIVINPHHEHP